MRALPVVDEDPGPTKAEPALEPGEIPAPLGKRVVAVYETAVHDAQLGHVERHVVAREPVQEPHEGFGGEPVEERHVTLFVAAADEVVLALPYHVEDEGDLIGRILAVHVQASDVVALRVAVAGADRHVLAEVPAEVDHACAPVPRTDHVAEQRKRIVTTPVVDEDDLDLVLDRLSAEHALEHGLDVRAEVLREGAVVVDRDDERDEQREVLLVHGGGALYGVRSPHLHAARVT